MVGRSVDWFLRSRTTGRITIAQLPNLSLALFIGLRIAQALVASHGTAHDVLRWSAIAALVWWGLDELIRGVNPFRRLLGALVLTGILITS